jgi:hypothetical protein
MESSIPDPFQTLLPVDCRLLLLGAKPEAAERAIFETEDSKRSKRKIQRKRKRVPFHGVHSGSPFTVDCWLFMVLEPAKAFPFSRRLKRKKKRHHLQAEEEAEEEAEAEFERVMVNSIRLDSSMT